MVHKHKNNTRFKNITKMLDLT